MMEWKFCKTIAMLHRDRKQFDKILLHLSLNNSGPLVTELELTDTYFNSNFPVPGNAEIECIFRVKKDGNVFFSKAFVAIDSPQDNLSV